MTNQKEFIAALKEIADPANVAGVAQYFHDDPNGHSSDNKVLGVRHGKIFGIAKKFSDMPLADVEKLLDNRFYEVRMGAVSIMDFQARDKRITPEHRKALFDLYLRRHDRINNWDLVDRAAPYVVGGYLADRSRAILYRLARRRIPGNAVQRSSARTTSSAQVILTIPSASPKSWSTISTSWSRKPSARGFVKPV
jgi:hypothetical protein